jgi:hypothetical protein
MAQPRIASKTPTACAACYQQRPGVIHIDYAAALEGRLIDPSKPRGGHVDWVIICALCLRNGVALLPEEERSKVETLEQRIVDLETQLTATQAYADRVEDALSHRPERAAPKERPAKSTKPARPTARKERYERVQA